MSGHPHTRLYLELVSDHFRFLYARNKTPLYSAIVCNDGEISVLPILPPTADELGVVLETAEKPAAR